MPLIVCFVWRHYQPIDDLLETSITTKVVPQNNGKNVKQILKNNINITKREEDVPSQQTGAHGWTVVMKLALMEMIYEGICHKLLFATLQQMDPWCVKTTVHWMFFIHLASSGMGLTIIHFTSRADV